MGSEHGVGLPELVGELHAERQAFLVLVGGVGSEQFVLADEAVEGGLGDAIALQQTLLDAEAIDGPLVDSLVVEVGLAALMASRSSSGVALRTCPLSLRGWGVMPVTPWFL